jgi:hypothetical protein
MATKYLRLLSAIAVLGVAGFASGEETDLDASLARAAGTWTTPNGYFLTIDEKGKLSGSLASWGCTISGQLSPLGRSRKAYTLAVTFTGCPASPVDVLQWAPDAGDLNGSTVTGTAVLNTAVAPHQLELWTLIRTTNLQFAAYILTTCYSPRGPGKCY